MRLHHRYLCERDPRYQGAVIHHGSVERAIQHYNDFGDRRRQRLEERLRSSKPELLQLQLCYAKDLEDIAKGVGI